jgi:carbonic anhydrase
VTETHDASSSELGRLLAANADYARSFDAGGLPASPRGRLAILTCMDARIVLAEILGLRPGDANVVRNAGAVVTDDAIRSIVLSQRLLGTREIVVLGHTGCGLRGLDEERLRAELTADAGAEPDLAFGAFDDVDDHVRRQVERLADNPLVMAVPVHGFVYEVDTGRVRPVSARSA